MYLSFKKFSCMKIDINQTKNDILAGLTAAIVALPLALAFGVQSGLGAITGIYGAIMVGFFASLFGGTPTQVSGPTGPITVISAVVVATALETFGGLEAGMPYIMTTFLLAGIFQISFGFFRFGEVIKYMPYPVISGFMSGIGIIIILMQIFPMLGHDSPKKIFNIFLIIHQPLSAINWASLGLTLTTIFLIYVIPRFTKVLPSTLISFILVTIIASVLQLNVPVIGDIPTGFPGLHLDNFINIDWSYSSAIIISALTIAALGSIDSLLTSVIADNMTKTKHNSNKELVGQGIGNIATSLIGGLPGAGATMRTVINIKAGGKTRMSGMTHSIILLLVLMGAGKYAAIIPLSVLAGILITVGISIIDYKGLKHLLDVPRTDAFILLIVIFLTVFVDLLQAVGVGMVLATIFYMKKSAEINEQASRAGLLTDFSEEIYWADDNLLPASIREQVYIKHIDGPLFFGFTDTFKIMTQAIPKVKYVIIRMDRVPYIDQSGLYALEDAILYLKQKDITVLLAGIQPQPEGMLRRIFLIPDLLEEQFVLADFESCVKWVISEIQSKE
jgi:SulP family sulfate permease